MIPLIDLRPQFIYYEQKMDSWEVIDGDQETWRIRGCPVLKKTGLREHRNFVSNILEAQGIIFLCPKCYQTVGCHYCEVTFANKSVPDCMGVHNDRKEPVRWDVTGDSFTNLSTSPSVLVIGGCNWHGYITNGLVSII